MSGEGTIGRPRVGITGKGLRADLRHDFPEDIGVNVRDQLVQMESYGRLANTIVVNGLFITSHALDFWPRPQHRVQQKKNLGWRTTFQPRPSTTEWVRLASSRIRAAGAEAEEISINLTIGITQHLHQTPELRRRHFLFFFFLL